MKTFNTAIISILLWIICPLSPSTAQAVPARDSLRIAILLYPGVELLDFAGPLEVFNHMEGANVYTVATQVKPMSIMRKMLTVTPDYTLQTAPTPDILVIPGGDVKDVLADPSIIGWITHVSSGSQLTMSVCTGTFLLGKAGLLDGKTITTHWSATQMLQQMTPKATVMEHTRFVEQGKLLTTAGVSAGIDGALRVVSRLKGPEAAQQIAQIMEYDKWEPQNGLIAGQKPTGSAKKAHQSVRKPMAVTKTVALKQNQLTLSSTIDPVCQMSVDGFVADTVRYMGKTYGFCSKLCKVRFKKEPMAYLKH